MCKYFSVLNGFLVGFWLVILIGQVWSVILVVVVVFRWKGIMLLRLLGVIGVLFWLVIIKFKFWLFDIIVWLEMVLVFRCIVK